MATCNKCGAQVDDSATFCMACGATLTPTQPVQPPFEQATPQTEQPVENAQPTQEEVVAQPLFKNQKTYNLIQMILMCAAAFFAFLGTFLVGYGIWYKGKSYADGMIIEGLTFNHWSNAIVSIVFIIALIAVAILFGFAVYKLIKKQNFNKLVAAMLIVFWGLAAFIYAVNHVSAGSVVSVSSATVAFLVLTLLFGLGAKVLQIVNNFNSEDKKVGNLILKYIPYVLYPIAMLGIGFCAVKVGHESYSAWALGVTGLGIPAKMLVLFTVIIYIEMGILFVQGKMKQSASLSISAAILQIGSFVISMIYAKELIGSGVTVAVGGIIGIILTVALAVILNINSRKAK